MGVRPSGASHIFDRHIRIDTMLIIKIDVVRVEPSQRVVCHLSDVFGATVPISGARIIPIDLKTEFSLDIHPRRVEEGDALCRS